MERLRDKGRLLVSAATKDAHQLRSSSFFDDGDGDGGDEKKVELAASREPLMSTVTAASGPRQVDNLAT